MFSNPLALFIAVFHWILAVLSPNDTQLSQNIRNLTWGNLNFVHTTDTHGWLSGHANQPQYHADWADFITFTTNLKAIAHANGQDLLLIDTGDKHDGNGLSDATEPNGNKLLPIFAEQDYDLLTIGNHELYVWENSKLEYEFIVSRYQEKYISTNVEILVDGEYVPMGRKYRYFTTPINGYRILALGFLFDFMKANKGTRVTPIGDILHTKWFRDMLDDFPEEKVDYVVVIGHIPITHAWEELQQLHQFLRGLYPNTVIQYFGGHSHIRDFVVNDVNSTGLESGRFCETVGWVSIGEGEGLERFLRSYIDFNRESFDHHTRAVGPGSELGLSGPGSGADGPTGQARRVKSMIHSARSELQLDKVLGQVSTNYYVDYVPLEHSHNLFRMLTDKVLPTLTGNQTCGERIVLINTGSVRYDLYKGPYTVDSRYIISPFENDWVKIRMPKSVGVRVSAILNRGSYINLLPRHQQFMVQRQLEQLPQEDLALDPLDRLDSLLKQYPLVVALASQAKLSKGYRTHDDFGDTGDDTVHKPVVNFPIPNVVQSVQFSSNEDDDIDFVFYNFLTWNVLEALKELTGRDYLEEIYFYSDMYLGSWLTEYIEGGNLN